MRESKKDFESENLVTSDQNTATENGRNVNNPRHKAPSDLKFISTLFPKLSFMNIQPWLPAVRKG